MAFDAKDAIAKARARVAELKAKQDADKEKMAATINSHMTNMVVPSLSRLGWKIDSSKPWNTEQTNAINMGLSRKDFVLIGAAGTGKTSTLGGIIRSMLANDLIPMIQQNETTKWLQAGTPGAVLTSFTNMAVRQIAKNFRDVAVTCVTLHKLLEFAPVKYTVEGPEGPVTKMVFEPTRNKFNPLPRSLKLVVIDESSMVDISLVDLLIDALPDPASVQFIFLGDLNQLPPVFGGPILGKKLLELPIVELVQVYRQALESPIISLAHTIKEGKSRPVKDGPKEVIDKGEHGKVTIHPWGKSLSWEDALDKAGNWCKAAIDSGFLDPDQDIILCPFNVKFGVLELNARIADFLGRKRNAKVWEIIAGFETHYYAVGDKVLVNKREAIITKITRNPRYAGKRAIDPDFYDLDRWGGAKKKATNLTESEEWAKSVDFDADAFLESMVVTEVEERVHSCSHLITVMFIDSHIKGQGLADAEYFELSTAAQVNEMLFAYAITVHKSQGSEWRKVAIITHTSHAQMQSRELLYTAITRAKEELYIICEPDRGMRAGTLTKAAKNPRLKGNTLAEKLIALKEKFDKEAKETAKKRKEEDDE